MFTLTLDSFIVFIIRQLSSRSYSPKAFMGSNMATPLEIISDVTKKVDGKIVEDLSIVNNCNRKKIHDCIRQNIMEIQIIPNYVNIYNTVMDKKSQSKLRSSSYWTVMYFKLCHDLHEKLLTDIKEAVKVVETDVEVSERDLKVLLNFYASVALQSLNATENSSNRNFEDVSNSKYVGCNDNRTSYLCLGGGTLGEIINVSKKRMKSLSLSMQEKQRASRQLDVAKTVCMTADDKQCLPEELKARDRGGMYFPKTEFLSFISDVNKATVKYASNSGLQRHGSELLKVNYLQLFICCGTCIMK